MAGVLLLAACGPSVKPVTVSTAAPAPVAAPSVPSPPAVTPTTPASAAATPATTAPPSAATTTSTSPPSASPPGAATATPPTTTPPIRLAVQVDGAGIGFAQAYTPLWEPAAELARDFDAIRATGAKWVRFDVMWSVIQGDGRDSWDWSTADRAIQAARARGLSVLATLTNTPGWARAAGATSDKFAPVDPADFARFAAAAVARYAPQGVHAYEIWNEPNVGFWAPKPDPVAYTTLLKVAYPAIHGADPSATVVTGGTAPVGPRLDWVSSGATEMSAWHFTQAIYAAGAAGSFDALGYHPYSLPGGPLVTGEWAPFAQTANLHTLMAQNGDGAKAIWGTEVGAPTGTEWFAVDEATQANWAQDYATLWRSWSFAGPLFYYSLRDRSNNAAASEDQFGLMRPDYTPKAAYTALANLVSGP